MKTMMRKKNKHTKLCKPTSDNISEIFFFLRKYNLTNWEFENEMKYIEREAKMRN